MVQGFPQIRLQKAAFFWRKKNDATHLPIIKVSRNSKFDITNLQMAPHAFGVLQDPDLV